jgi:leucyl aminopeptidase
VLKLISRDLKKIESDCLAIPVCEDGAILDRPGFAPLTARAKKFGEFQGRRGDTLWLYGPARLPAERVLYLGLGKREEVSAETLRAFAGEAVRAAMEKSLAHIMLAAPAVRKTGLDAKTVLSALMEGACLGNHVFDRYKSEKKHRPLQEVDILVDPETVKAHGSLARRVSDLCRGTLLARDWVSIPSNDKRPIQFARMIEKAALKEKLRVRILDEKALKKQKFGALLAVAAGSSSRPAMVILEYAPRGAEKTVALVGKGVTFDSGGLNLKPTGSLETMKIDMAGAAAVAATLITAAKLKPAVRLIGAVPIVENMVSGEATRPGDIITSFNGKTVEIGNTDAEGRLILADAMAYVVKTFKPDVMFDMATLTGACVVALGEKIAGVFSPEDDLAERVIRAGERTHERCWRMPLPDDYRELLKSDSADIKNIGSSRWGGAISAALFLSEFVGNTRWAHIDIAGPAYAKKESPYCGSGGTGFGVRLFFDLLENL